MFTQLGQVRFFAVVFVGHQVSLPGYLPGLLFNQGGQDYAQQAGLLRGGDFVSQHAPGHLQGGLGAAIHGHLYLGDVDGAPHTARIGGGDAVNRAVQVATLGKRHPQDFAQIVAQIVGGGH